MNALAEKEPVITPGIAERIREYVTRTGISVAEIAKTTSYGRATVSLYLNGKYNSNAEKLEGELLEYLSDHDGGSSNLSVIGKGKRPDFFSSRDAKSVMGVCQSCQDYGGLGIVVGRSGYGKTYTLKRYAKLPKVAYIECDDTMSSRDLVDAMEQALGIPGGYGTIWKRINGIREFFSANKGYLLIIDEADKLISKYTQKKMEILRGIFDQSEVGVVIAGEPKLEAQIKMYLDRMANRMDFYASLQGLSGAEVEDFLSGLPIEEKAMAELKARACNKQTGCFRLLDRTMNNVLRVLREGGKEITLKTIEQASGMMML